MITPAYESFVNNVCVDIANESISDKIKSGWNKVIKFWDSVIKFIQKKINEFISFIKNIFTKKKKFPETGKDSKDKSNDINAENNPNYDNYCKVSGNLYLLCVNICKLPTETNHYLVNIKKNSDYIYYLAPSLEDANILIDDPEEFVNVENLCTVSGKDKDHLNEDWIIEKDRLSTLAKYLSMAKDQIISIKKELEKFEPDSFGNEYTIIQNSMILCGKISSKLISRACEIKNNVSSVSQDDFDNLYHKF